MPEHENADRTEAQIRARIERTRANMGATIEEIGAHLNPAHLKQEFTTGVREQVEQTKREIRDATIGRAEALMHNVEETVNHTSRTLIDTIRDNPVPAAMAGIGLGWLIADARRDQSHYEGRYYAPTDHRERTRGGIATSRPGYVSTANYSSSPMSRTDRAGDRAGEMGRAVREEADEMTEQARAAASDVADQARDAADRAGDMFTGAVDQVQRAASGAVDRAQHVAEETWEEAEYRARQAKRMAQSSPLAAGAVTMALGFAAGMMIPETPQEDRLMGSARDRLLDRAEDAARHTAERVERVAERTAAEAERTAEREARRQGLTGAPASGSRTL